MHGEPSRTSLRGAATIEAVLALFTFIILWVGVNYMGVLHTAQLEDQAQARKCAWLASVQGCKSEVDGCSTADAPGNAKGKDKKLIESGDKASEGDGVLARAMRGALMRQLKGLFESRTVAHAGTDHERPPTLGGGETTTSASYSLPCNTKNETLGDLAKDTMKQILGGKKP